MEIKKAVAVGRTWFAIVEGEKLPCVHHKWWTNIGGLRRYSDPGLAPGPKYDAFVNAIRETRKVVLTQDKVISLNDKPTTAENPTAFKRLDYIAVWTIDDIDFDETGLRFTFIDKVCELKR